VRIIFLVDFQHRLPLDVFPPVGSVSRIVILQCLTVRGIIIPSFPAMVYMRCPVQSLQRMQHTITIVISQNPKQGHEFDTRGNESSRIFPKEPMWVLLVLEHGWLGTSRHQTAIEIRRWRADPATGLHPRPETVACVTSDVEPCVHIISRSCRALEMHIKECR
jgi:hypothetical protein